MISVTCIKNFVPFALFVVLITDRLSYNLNTFIFQSQPVLCCALEVVQLELFIVYCQPITKINNLLVILTLPWNSFDHYLPSSSFTGFNLGSVQIIPYLHDADKYKHIVFLTCRNYIQQSKGMICAASDFKFEISHPKSISLAPWFFCKVYFTVWEIRHWCLLSTNGRDQYPLTNLSLKLSSPMDVVDSF